MVCAKILIAIFASVAFAQGLELGRCPYVRPQTDLDQNKLVGFWHEYARYPIATELLDKCVNLEFQNSDQGGLLVSKNVINRLTQQESSTSGTAVAGAPGTLKLTPDGLSGNYRSAVVNVLGTDYENYAVLFICNEVFGFGVFHENNAFILTRERLPNLEVINNAKAALSSNGLPVKSLNPVDQLNCPEKQ